jgi:hypothetical protein
MDKNSKQLQDDDEFATWVKRCMIQFPSYIQVFLGGPSIRCHRSEADRRQLAPLPGLRMAKYFRIVFALLLLLPIRSLQI